MWRSCSFSGRGQNAILGEMDVGINETRHDKPVSKIIRWPWMIDLRKGMRCTCPSNAAIAGDGNGTLLLVFARWAFAGKTEGLALDDFHGNTRSSRRKRKMRMTWFKAVSNSASLLLFRRCSKLSMIWCLVAPFTAKMNGKPKRCL